jgi:hypothetical protein
VPRLRKRSWHQIQAWKEAEAGREETATYASAKEKGGPEEPPEKHWTQLRTTKHGCIRLGNRRWPAIDPAECKHNPTEIQSDTTNGPIFHN